MERRLLIVKAGTTVAPVRSRRGDFEDWICAGMGWDREGVEVVSVFLDEPLSPPDTYCGVVVTGSSAFVSEREAWSERTAAWLLAALETDVPILGICYGHQLLAHATGGRVGPNPHGREIGSVEIEVRGRDDDLLSGLSTHEVFQASHLESVLELPARAVGLASSAADANHAFALGDRAWGVQFHPEFDADIVRGYIDARRDQLETEDLDPDRLSAQSRDSDAGARVLERFARIVRREPF